MMGGMRVEIYAAVFMGLLIIYLFMFFLYLSCM